ncbi:LOW QUALITY PROTEIN: probable U3 small nucleolar RNA-associated protein 11 [Pecten maximus]|uniref:LOW QUALITY PROTEIN: probable U3 small nucleolar RNA-associated protein 11 n=1 Tax=Pecten maximus TaxID=6579 RepID=UPI0014585A54|nr:LOW QUALITY PROTEIN: probable U3 small nucleolar RNA-associated protein 11 [Pecten maximus]
MASLRNLEKARARKHRERSQPAARAKLGYLEKKKDYKERASDYHRQQNTLKALKKKALNRNPDEFYFNMVRTQKVDGVHQRKEETEPEVTEVQTKFMFSQDLRYVNMKRTAELKKIEKLKSSLHLLDSEDKPKNKHTIFVDTEKDVKKFDAAKHFDTHPSLLGRAYNRPTTQMLQTGQIPAPADQTELEELAKEQEKKYKELTKRIEREKELRIIAQKLEMKKHLMAKKEKKKKIADETKTSAAQYRWCTQRKK